MSATPEVPPLEIIPFGPGGEKLGMTRYERGELHPVSNSPFPWS